MKILKWQGTAGNYQDVLTVLKKGGVIVYPTETAYGLGADPMNTKAVKRIYLIKQRDKNKPLPLIAANWAQVIKYCRLSEQEKTLAKKKWPGPFTFVLPRKSSQDGLAFKNDTLAIRVSSSAVAGKIAKKLGHPLISTSANIAGSVPLYEVDAIWQSFANKTYQPDLIIDFGKLPSRAVSKIIKFENKKPVYLR